MQVQSGAILAGPEAGPVEHRHEAALVASAYVLLLALGAGVAGSLVGIVALYAFGPFAVSLTRSVLTPSSVTNTRATPESASMTFATTGMSVADPSV